MGMVLAFALGETNRMPLDSGRVKLAREYDAAARRLRWLERGVPHMERKPVAAPR